MHPSLSVVSAAQKGSLCDCRIGATTSLLPSLPSFLFCHYLALSLLLFQHEDLLVLLFQGAGTEKQGVLHRVLVEEGGKEGREGGAT